MTRLPAGFVRTPNVVAGALIALAVRPLPAAHRGRYSDEFRAEVCCLPGRQQVFEAASVLAGCFALSRALQEDAMPTDQKSHLPIRCRVGWHSYQTVGADNVENRKDRHKECTDCGKTKEMDMYGPTDGRYLGGYGPLA